MPKQKPFVIQYRYIKPEEDDPFWFGVFGCGKWKKWRAYKKKRDAENALLALKKPNKWNAFEFRHAPDKS